MDPLLAKVLDKTPASHYSDYVDMGQARQLAESLMQEHLGDLNRVWSFKFDRAKQRFGCCWHSKKLITLSEPLTAINSVSEVRDTILHEIAHALCGANVNHGPEWKAMARKVGAKPERCYSSARVAAVTPTWIGECPSGCGYVRARYRRSDDWCPRCFNAYANATVQERAQRQLCLNSLVWRRVNR